MTTKIETPVTITAVWLVRVADDHAEVRVEIDGKWYRAIREHLDGPFSWIAEGNGRENWPECDFSEPPRGKDET